MDETAFWDRERAFWLDGEPKFREMMAPDCVMVFPDPVGILSGEAILESLRSLPRWTNVAMTQASLARFDDAVTVLAYHAEAQRRGHGAYRAFCGSTYTMTAEGWRLVLHQQTPV